MRYKLLGKSGLRVSEICLGTMTFGEEWGWGANSDESRAMYEAFREAGAKFIKYLNMETDTAKSGRYGSAMMPSRVNSRKRT